MGAGASVEGVSNLSDADKTKIVSDLRDIYERQKQSGSTDDLSIFEEVKHVYESTVAMPATDGKPKKGRRPSAFGSANVTSIPEDAEVAAARAAAAQMEDPSPAVASSNKDFRKRRLTLTTRRQKNTKDAAVPATQGASRPAHHDAPHSDGTKLNGTPNRRHSVTRTFQSHEIGDVPDIQQPFPLDVVGTYSCHGIEPSWEDEGYSAKINQDRGTVCHPYADCEMAALFAVFDGHGEKGDKVSHFVMTEVQRRLEKHPEISTNPPHAFKETFVEVNRLLGDKVSHVDALYSGTTAIAVLIRGNTMWTSNIGDSRAVMATIKDGKLQAEALSHDHNPDSPEEKKRILAAGGFVSPPPEPGLSARVWLDPEMTQIGLAMARSVGDHAVKAIGVIPEPEVIERQIQPEDQFMVLASDGVWEFIPNQEAISIVAEHMKDGATAACQKLIETAAERWRYNEGDYRDDITAIVARIPCMEPANPQSVSSG